MFACSFLAGGNKIILPPTMTPTGLTIPDGYNFIPNGNSFWAAAANSSTISEYDSDGVLTGNTESVATTASSRTGAFVNDHYLLGTTSNFYYDIYDNAWNYIKRVTIPLNRTTVSACETGLGIFVLTTTGLLHSIDGNFDYIAEVADWSKSGTQWVGIASVGDKFWVAEVDAGSGDGSFIVEYDSAFVATGSKVAFTPTNFWTGYDGLYYNSGSGLTTEYT